MQKLKDSCDIKIWEITALEVINELRCVLFEIVGFNLMPIWELFIWNDFRLYTPKHIYIYLGRQYKYSGWE